MSLTLQRAHKVRKAQLGLVTRQDGLGERPRWRVCDCITCTCQRYGGRSLPDTRCSYEKSWFDTPDKINWVTGEWWNGVLNLQTIVSDQSCLWQEYFKFEIPDDKFWSDSPDKSIPSLLLQWRKWCIGPEMRLDTRFVYTRLHTRYGCIPGCIPDTYTRGSCVWLYHQTRWIEWRGCEKMEGDFHCIRDHL